MDEQTLFLSAVFIIFGFALGACMGSFSSALIWRIPRKIPWAYDSNFRAVRSQCPSCNKILSASDLIPIISWCFQKGRCRSCENKIGAIYPFLEMICGLSGALLFFLVGVSYSTVTLLIFGVFLFIFSWVGCFHKQWSLHILIILVFLGILLFF